MNLSARQAANTLRYCADALESGYKERLPSAPRAATTWEQADLYAELWALDQSLRGKLTEARQHVAATAANVTATLPPIHWHHRLLGLDVSGEARTVIEQRSRSVVDRIDRVEASLPTAHALHVSPIQSLSVLARVETVDGGGCPWPIDRVQRVKEAHYRELGRWSAKAADLFNGAVVEFMEVTDSQVKRHCGVVDSMKATVQEQRDRVMRERAAVGL